MRWGFLVVAAMMKSLAETALGFSWALRAGAGAGRFLQISFARFWTSVVFLIALEFPAFAAPNAMWVKQDGSVELTEIVGETSDVYLLTARFPSGSVGKIGVSKRQIAFCSMSARNWSDLCRAILQQKQPALFDRIAAYYGTPRTTAPPVPPGAVDVPADAAVFNQLPENLRRILVKLAFRESFDVATNARAMEEAVAKYEAKVREAQRQAPESSEARKKAIEAFYPALLADLSFPVSALLLADASAVINDFQVRRLLKATQQGLPIPNQRVLTAYHALALANILGADLHRPETSIVFPRLEDQDLFDSTNNNVRMANDGKYGHLELVDAGNGEIFLSSPIIPAGPTLNTHILCLADMDAAMKQFFASDAGKSGKFLLLAARSSPDVEKRQGISFVRAKPVLVITLTDTGDLMTLYAEATNPSDISAWRAFTLQNPGPAKEQTISEKTATANAGGRVLHGSWKLVSNDLDLDIEIGEDGFTADKQYRLRQSGSLVLLRGPDKTWTLDWQHDGSLAGKCDTSTATITLKRP